MPESAALAFATDADFAAGGKLDLLGFEGAVVDPNVEAGFG
jgi:hypothetical protein